jgi:hypothetical protein
MRTQHRVIATSRTTGAARNTSIRARAGHQAPTPRGTTRTRHRWARKIKFGWLTVSLDTVTPEAFPYGGGMVRPASCLRPAGVSPVPVSAGAPGSRPRFVGEIWRAERGVESLFGGSKSAGRSVKRTLQPRQTDSGRAEPLMSRRRPCLF